MKTEFGSQVLPQKLGKRYISVTSELGEERLGHPGAWWPTDLAKLVSSRFTERPCLKKHNGECLTETHDFDLCFPHTYTHKWIDTGTHTPFIHDAHPTVPVRVLPMRWTKCGGKNDRDRSEGERLGMDAAFLADANTWEGCEGIQVGRHSVVLRLLTSA